LGPATQAGAAAELTVRWADVAALESLQAVALEFNRALRVATLPLVGIGVGVCVLLSVWVVTPVHVSGPPTVLLPKTGSPDPIASGTADVYVTVWPEGRCAIGRQIVACVDLAKQLADLWRSDQRRVLVRGDERVSYAEVRAVLESVRDAGFRGTILVTKQARHD
jgi:biopolymer transport protein ExbD